MLMTINIPKRSNITNGDVILAVIPDSKIKEIDHENKCVYVDFPQNKTIESFDIEWWFKSYSGKENIK
jgi:hypothetical protein